MTICHWYDSLPHPFSFDFADCVAQGREFIFKGEGNYRAYERIPGTRICRRRTSFFFPLSLY